MEISNQKKLNAFNSLGNYDLIKDEFILKTEIPNVSLRDQEGAEYKLKHSGFYNISSKLIPCLLSVFKHGHPDKGVLNQSSLKWDIRTQVLSSVFADTNFPLSRILVITMHDEDFKESDIEKYKKFIDDEVTFNKSNTSFVYNIQMIEKYLDKEFVVDSNEEPRTVGGGVLDPA